MNCINAAIVGKFMIKLMQYRSYVFACMFFTVLSFAASSEPEILGWLEGAYLQPWGVRVRAKLDSGALTGSIHGEQIEVFEKAGGEWIRFHFPYGKREGYEHGFQVERPLIRQSRVKDHDSPSSTRYVIELDVCVSGKTNTMQFSVTDRSNFNYPIIIGRKDLAGRYIIDPGRTFSGKRTCPRRLKGSAPVRNEHHNTGN